MSIIPEWIKWKQPVPQQKDQKDQQVQYFKLPAIKDVNVKYQVNCDMYDHWRVTDQLISSGSYGKVVTVCDANEVDNCDYVAKEVLFYETPEKKWFDDKWYHNHFIGEAMISQYAGKNKFGIPVHGYFLCDGGRRGVMIQNRFDGTLNRHGLKLTAADGMYLAGLIKRMHACGIFHQDLFAKNVMFRDRKEAGQVPRRQFRIIDFGLSVVFDKGVPPQLRAIDYITLMRDIPVPAVQMQLYNVSIRENGLKNHEQAEKWLNSRDKLCGADLFLLNHLPDYLYYFYGPAISILMAWSTRCNKDNYVKIMNLIQKRLKQKNIIV